MPDVAIIIPCFNDGALVRETLASIRTGLDVEVVIVDDGSTDEVTISVLSQLEQRGAATVLHVPNGGPGRARMAGVAATNAPYVLPLDADDQLAPGGLEALRETLEQDASIAFAFGDYEAFGSASGRWVTPAWNAWSLLYANWWPVTSMFRRHELVDAGGWQLHGYEDWDLWMALAERGRIGRHCGTVVYRRRLHANRLNMAARREHRVRYGILRSRHAALFKRRRELRREFGASALQRCLYPLVLGNRRLFPVPLENFVIARRLRAGRHGIR